MDLSNNATYHGKTKNITKRYHSIRDVLEEGEFVLEKIHTSRNPSNMLTKMVPREKHELCQKLIGME